MLNNKKNIVLFNNNNENYKNDVLLQLKKKEPIFNSYILFGYLKNDTYILSLYGRERIRNRYDFYVSPWNKEYSNIIIPLPDNTIKDIYNIPSKIYIKDVFPGEYTYYELR